MRWQHRALERWPPQFPWLKTHGFLVSNISPQVLVAWWSPNQTFSQCGLQSLVTHSAEAGIRQTWAEVLWDSCGNSGPLTSGVVSPPAKWDYLNLPINVASFNPKCQTVLAWNHCVLVYLSLK